MFADDAAMPGPGGLAHGFTFGYMTFVLGAEAIGRAVSVGSPPTGSQVSWAPDRVIVASSGDLGVTVGTIRPNAPAAGAAAAGIPFFTIWRRANSSAPWRYVAE
jgi:hypothetical protein